MHAFQGVGRGPYPSSWVSPLDLLAELFSKLGFSGVGCPWIGSSRLMMSIHLLQGEAHVGWNIYLLFWVKMWIRSPSFRLFYLCGFTPTEDDVLSSFEHDGWMSLMCCSGKTVMEGTRLGLYNGNLRQCILDGEEGVSGNFDDKVTAFFENMLHQVGRMDLTTQMMNTASGDLEWAADDWHILSSS
jgi:hypothetical protein